MTPYAFRLLNVFAESTFGGNPLCVFDDARGMDDATMQALAVQFNLSETTFVLPSERAQARVLLQRQGRGRGGRGCRRGRGRGRRRAQPQQRAGVCAVEAGVLEGLRRGGSARRRVLLCAPAASSSARSVGARFWG